MMNDPYLRLSVLGEHRNVDLVVPSEQPGSALLPQLLDLLDETGGQGSYMLTTTLGEPVDLETPLGHAGLDDGVVLRLTQDSDAPPVPVISDLVDATAEHETAGRWTPTTRSWVLGAGSVFMLLAAAVLLIGPGRVTVAEVAFMSAGCYLLSTALVLLSRPLAWTYFVAGVATSLCWAWLQLLSGWPPLLVLLVWLSVLLTALIVHTRHQFAYATGLVVLAGCAGLWWLVQWLVEHPIRAGATAATLALLLLGLTPRLALAVAGLFKADEAAGRGINLAFSAVVGRLERAHGVLAISVSLVSLLWVVGMWPLALSSTTDVWTLALTGVLLVAWTLRGRHFPLAVERAAIYAAALIVVGAFAWSVQDLPWVALGLALLGVLLAAVQFLPVSELAGAQLRRAATWVETLMVVATVPILVGMFGLYTELLGAFR